MKSEQEVRKKLEGLFEKKSKMIILTDRIEIKRINREIDMLKWVLEEEDKMG